MADDIVPGPDPGCDEVRDSVELLALDALEPAEAARLMAHVESCPSCRSELDRAEATVGELLALVPDAEVPAGFVDSVVDATVAAPVAEPAVAVGGAAAVRPGSRRWFALAVVAVVAALLVTALGALFSGAFSSDGQVAGPPVTASAQARSAALVRVDGASVGSVTVDDGTGTLFMVVDTVVPGVPYDCVVRSASGELVRVGSWTTTAGGSASWTVALDPALGSVDQVLLVGPGDTTLATAQLT
jgi:hypothetical protein